MKNKQIISIAPENFEKNYQNNFAKLLALRGFSMRLILEKTGLTKYQACNIIYKSGITLSRYRNGESSLAKKAISFIHKEYYHKMLPKVRIHALPKRLKISA